MQYIYLWRTEQFLVLSTQANSLCQDPKVSGAILLSVVLLRQIINNQASAVWYTHRYHKSNHQGELNRLPQTPKLNILTEVLDSQWCAAKQMIDLCVPSSPALSSTSVCFTGVQICIRLSYPE